MMRSIRFVFQVLLLTALLAELLGASSLHSAQALATGEIAYSPFFTQNEIRIINADGSGDRQLWSTGRADQESADDISSLSWRPDGGALVFASTHEAICSINHADVFLLNADGSGYRRLTEAPGCAALAGMPQGQVQVPVVNNSTESFTGFVYFQGAASAQMVNLAPRASTTVTFPSVADMGAGEKQVGAFFQGARRKIDALTDVDVVAGGSVTSPTLYVWPLSMYDVWETRSSTLRYGGQKAAYVLNLDSIRAIATNATNLDFGEPLLSAPQSSMSDFVSHLAYGPTIATANQLLYVGSNSYDSRSVYLVNEGSATPGAPLVTHDSADMILGLSWLPDASGFVYAVMERVFDPEYVVSANIFLYTFSTKQVTRVTNLEGEFAGQLSVSPDSQQIVFERSQKEDPYGDAEKTDLWIVNRDGSGLRLLKTDAFAPAWSPGTAPVVTYDRYLYLPFTIR